MASLIYLTLCDLHRQLYKYPSYECIVSMKSFFTDNPAENILLYRIGRIITVELNKYDEYSQ